MESKLEDTWMFHFCEEHATDLIVNKTIRMNTLEHETYTWKWLKEPINQGWRECDWNGCDFGIDHSVLVRWNQINQNALKDFDE